MAAAGARVVLSPGAGVALCGGKVILPTHHPRAVQDGQLDLCASLRRGAVGLGDGVDGSRSRIVRAPLAGGAPVESTRPG